MTAIAASFKPGAGCLALASGKKIIAAFETTDKSACTGDAVQLHTLSITELPVVCLSFSPSGKLLAACSDDKTLRIWEVGNGWSCKGQRVLPKRATALSFTKDDGFILVADKAGDVHQYQVTDLSLSGTLLLGHLSMLLDMVLLPSNSHVITCDRDEKIRVSKYPNTYNIETFCLQHTEFVSQMCVCKQWPHLLISASGDGTIMSWDWVSGRVLDKAVCSRSVIGDDGSPEAVTGVCCSSGGHTQPLVVASLESSPLLLVFSLSSDGKLTECSEATLTLATPPLSFTFDWSDRLWVCLNHQPEPILCYKQQDNKLIKLSASENPLLEKLNSSDDFIELKPRDWDSLRKREFDNLSSYYARKTERIKEQEEKKELASKAVKTKTTMSTVDRTETKDSSQLANEQSLSSSSDPLPDAKRLRRDSED